MLAAENDNLSDSNRKQLSGVFREMEKWLTEVFNSHSAELASPVPVLQLARSVIAGLEGALLIDRVAGNRQCFAAQKAVMLGYLA